MTSLKLLCSCINTEQYRRYVHPDLQPIAPKVAQPVTAFVTVKNPLATMLRLEFIGKDGTALHCYYPNTAMLHETIQWFLEA